MKRIRKAKTIEDELYEALMLKGISPKYAGPLAESKAALKLAAAEKERARGESRKPGRERGR
jgi:hypothetical protein